MKRKARQNGIIYGAFVSRLVIVFTALSFLFTATSCTGGQSEKRTIKADVDVKVSDPDIRRFTDVTAKADISASGIFHAGTFVVNNAVLVIPPGTNFRLNLELPINNPGVISTSDATGTLWMSQSISVDAVPLPQTIELDKGKVSGKLDLGRLLAAFFFNILQVGVDTGSFTEILHKVRMDKVVLNLRPGSTFKFGQKSIHVGPDSKVELTNASLEDKLNFEGELTAKLNFAKGCKWIGEKVDCEFDGGKLNVLLRAKKDSNSWTLSLPNPVKVAEPIVLENCTMRFGKNKRSSTLSKTCTIDMKEFAWQHLKSREHPTMHLMAAMNLSGTNLHLKTDIHQTIGYFPETVPGRLSVNIKEDSRDMTFTTTAAAHAQTGTIIIAKNETNLELTLANVVIGPVGYTKSGALNFSLEKGVASLKQFEWKAGDQKFTLTCGPGSTLTVPGEMLLEKADPKGKTALNLPLKLAVGKAALHTKKGVIDLEDVAGKVLIDVDGNIRIKSDLDFAIKRTALLNGSRTEIKARALDIFLNDGKANIQFGKCSMLLPGEALRDAIKKRLPQTFTLELNKTIKEDKTWRYRNAIAEDVNVKNLTIEKMESKGANKMGFTASGDVELKGTVEKGGIIFNSKDGWETKPWTLSGHFVGDGIVQYNCSNKPEGQLEYKLSAELPIPDDVKLDWSQVAGGLLKVAERKAILGRLKKITVPLNHDGEVLLVEKEDPIWKNFSFSKLSIQDTMGGNSIDFAAQTRM